MQLNTSLTASATDRYCDAALMPDLIRHLMG